MSSFLFRALLGLFLLVGVSCASASPDSAAPGSTTTTTPDPTSSTSTTTTPAPSTSSTSTTTTLAPTTTTTAPPTALECVSDLPGPVKLGQLLMPLVTEEEVVELEGLAAFGVAGGATILGTPGLGLPGSLEAVQAAAAPVPLLIAADEEGGTVQRLDGLLGPLPSASVVAATMTPDEARSLAADYGTQMKLLGVNMALAPVADVGRGPGIESRSFSESQEVVTEYAAATAEGYLDAGVIPVLKHFPGHGRASGDSHQVLPTSPPLGELSFNDLLPYVELLGIDGVAVMVGHLDVPGLTDGVPASLSPAAIDGLLRGELGFDGLVLTDSLAMGAVDAFGTGEAARLALLAGADVVIVPSPSSVPPLLESLRADIDAGRLGWDVVDDSVVRVLAAKDVQPCSLAQR